MQYSAGVSWGECDLSKKGWSWHNSLLLLPSDLFLLSSLQVSCSCRNRRRNCNKPGYILGQQSYFAYLFKHVYPDMLQVTRRWRCVILTQSEPRNYMSLSEKWNPKDCLIICNSKLHERANIKNWAFGSRYTPASKISDHPINHVKRKKNIRN